jgi:hypothetical protein
MASSESLQRKYTLVKRNRQMPHYSKVPANGRDSFTLPWGVLSLVTRTEPQGAGEMLRGMMIRTNDLASAGRLRRPLQEPSRLHLQVSKLI